LPIAAGARSRDADDVSARRVTWVGRRTLRSWHSPRALIDDAAAHQSDRGERAEQMAFSSSQSPLISCLVVSLSPLYGLCPLLLPFTDAAICIYTSLFTSKDNINNLTKLN